MMFAPAAPTEVKWSQMPQHHGLKLLVKKGTTPIDAKSFVHSPVGVGVWCGEVACPGACHARVRKLKC